MNTNKTKLHIWEIALLIALCITLFSGLWAQAAQEKLQSELVRLHVVAESDSESDQAVKLKVRDAVLEYLTPKLKNAASADEAREIISGQLLALSNIAKGVTLSEGKNCAISSTIDTESFPTREYDGFALPAGDYVSLRITLGDGGGKNWWCVVFPPLCISSVASEEALGTLSEDSADIIAADSSGNYKLKFHIVELFDRLQRAFS